MTKARWGMVGALALLVVAALIFIPRGTKEVAPEPVPAAPAPAKPADAPLPSAAESDAQLRQQLGALSQEAPFQLWLRQDHLLDALSALVANLDEGRSPVRALELWKPQRPFEVVRKGGRLELSPRSAARYDAFADAVGSIDAQKAAGVYRTLHGLLEAGYHSVGRPDRALDAAVARALQRIAQAPVRDDAELKEKGALYVYADPQLEALGPVEKHLLRMGARNEKTVQAKAQQLAAALGMSAPAK